MNRLVVVERERETARSKNRRIADLCWNHSMQIQTKEEEEQPEDN